MSFWTSQGIALAADGDVYRRLDAAEAPFAWATNIDPGPMLPSPDGTSVALGQHDTESADLEFVNLETGEVTQQQAPADARSVRPLAWSPDGSHLAYLANQNERQSYQRHARVGTLHLLDLDSGTSEPVLDTDLAAAAFSPDGTQLAVQRPRDETLSIVDLTTGAVRTVQQAGRLTSPNAWSPDGQLLAVTRSTGIWAVNVSGTQADEATRVNFPNEEILGWTQERELLVFDRREENRAQIEAVSLETGEARELTEIGGTSNYGVYRVQLAAGLIDNLAVRDAGDADRGPLPLGSRALLALMAGFVTYLVVGWIRRRRGPSSDPGSLGGDVTGPTPAELLQPAAH